MRYLGMMSLAMFLFSVTTFSALAADPKDDAVRLVQLAAAYYRANGLEKTLDEVPNPKGAFNKGEMYVFVYDLNAVMLAHPNPKLVGQSMLELPDSTGKKYRREIVEKAARDGRGWTEYRYRNPKTKEDEYKISYYEKVDDLIVCCGIYKK